jgi:putative thioredoxin
MNMLELGQGAAPAASVSDTTESTFMADVVEASMNAPVIVAFWMPTSEQCKTVLSALEQAVAATKGKVSIVRADINANRMIAQQMRIEGVPAVFAFAGGRPVDGFMGIQPPDVLAEFVKRTAELGSEDEGDLTEALEAAEQMLAEGAVTDAAQTFSAILGEDRENLPALSGLARAYLALGDIEKAKGVLGMVPEKGREDPVIKAAAAQIELAESGADAGELDALKAAVESNPDDHQTRFDLALAYAAANRSEEAVNELLELFRRDREWNESAAKTQLFKLFDMLGPKDPVTLKGRRRLSSMIFA